MLALLHFSGRNHGRLICRCTNYYLYSVLAVHVGLVVWLSVSASPTLNEPAHLVAGISYLRHGEFSLYNVNPPLSRVLAALPACFSDIVIDSSRLTAEHSSRPVFYIAEEAMQREPKRVAQLVLLGRLILLPFSLLGAYTCYAWASKITGKLAGLSACTLWCFSPTILGNAALLTPDISATALGIFLLFRYSIWLKAPTWLGSLLIGGLLGTALLAKSTFILLLPILPLLWILHSFKCTNTEGTKRRSQACMILFIIAFGIYVLNLGYLGEGAMRPIGEFKFVSKLFRGNSADNRFEETVFSKLPVPVPANYLLGIDMQQRDFESMKKPSYLRGMFSENGWVGYYAYAFLVKSTTGFLALLTVALTGLVFWQRKHFRDSEFMVLIVPAAAIFVVASYKSGFSHHFRYVLPCLPACIVFTSCQVWDSCEYFTQIRKSSFGRRMCCFCIVACLCVHVVESLASTPCQLSFFNTISGGSKNGPEHLLNSNVDWGQDLFLLEKWIEQNSTRKSEPVFLAFYNGYTPFGLLDSEVKPWPFEHGELIATANIPRGHYAVSVNLLYGFPWPVRDQAGKRYLISQRPLQELREIEPVARIGYSIRVFSYEQMKEAFLREASR